MALLPRLVFQLEWYRPGSWSLPVIDALEYELDALRILEGRAESTVYWHAPGMSYFIAGVYALAGWVPARVGAVQALLGAWTCVVAFLLARRWSGPRWGLLAFAICALYGPLIYFEGQLLRATLFTALLTTWCWVHVRWLGDHGPWGALVSGLFLGATALVRETALILAPVAALGYAWPRRRPQRCAVRPSEPRAADTDAPSLPEEHPRPMTRRRSWLPAVALLLGTTVAIAPVTLRNWMAGGEPVLISSSGGVNFYIGNHPDGRALQEAGPGTSAWARITAAARRQKGALTPAERSHAFYLLGWEYWSRDPAGAAANTLRKAVELVSAHEIPRNQDLYLDREHSRVLSALAWRWGGFALPFGLLGPLAITGLLLGTAGRRERRLLAWMVLVYALITVVFFPAARYRVAWVPLLACFAVLGVRLLVRARGGARWRAVAVLVCAAVLVNGGWATVTSDPAARSYARAWSLQSRGRSVEAIGAYEELLRSHPDHLEARVNLAALYGLRGQARQALAAARGAIAIDSTDAQAWINLGNAQLMLSRTEAAERSLERGLRLQPDAPEGWSAYLRLLGPRKTGSHVIDLARLATRRWPADPVGWVRLGYLLREAHRLPEAEEALLEAIQRNPRSDEAWRQLDLVRAALKEEPAVSPSPAEPATPAR